VIELEEYAETHAQISWSHKEHGYALYRGVFLDMVNSVPVLDLQHHKSLPVGTLKILCRVREPELTVSTDVVKPRSPRGGYRLHRTQCRGLLRAAVGGP
jgi:hypothetical protein